MARTWGFWTVGKLDILRAYLDAFTTATKYGVTDRIYLDLFAGGLDNRERMTDEPIESSAQVALSTNDPQFSVLRFFEVEGKAQALESSLRKSHPGRDIKVYGGDCNERLHEALHALRGNAWAPTFAFVDPNGMEAEWRTLEALADFRRQERTKVELFVLFAAPQFMRLLPRDGSEVRPEDEQKIDSLFGTDDWQHINGARRAGKIEPGEARGQYLNLMRWRIENELGYRWTHPLSVRNVAGNEIYFMIFATDHEAGTRIMSGIYAKAAEEFPAMRENARRKRNQARDEQRGVMRMFEDESLVAPPAHGERFYEHEPPSRPWFL